MIIAQALLFEDGFRIVEAADEQVESDKFSFHKTILSLLAHLLPLLLIRIGYLGEGNPKRFGRANLAISPIL